MKKRVLAVILVIVLALSIFPVTTLAASGMYPKTEVSGRTKMINGKDVKVYSATTYADGYRDAAGGTISTSHKYSSLKLDGYWEFTPSVNDGYAFTGWTVPSGEDGYSVSGDTLKISYTSNKNYSATANFSWVGYNVTIDLGDGATFDDTGLSMKSQTGVPYGELSIPACTVKDGYSFVGWSAGTNITSNRTLTAKYEYQVSFAENDEHLSLSGATAVWTVNHTATAPAIVADTGYRADGWDRSLSGITGPTTITAKAAVRQVTLTLLVSNGYYGPARKTLQTFTYDAGKTVNLGDYLPWSVTGYFVRWVEKGTGVKYYSYRKQITLNNDTTYTAVFELGRFDQYVYTSAGSNGRLNKDLSGSYSSGDKVNLTTALPVATTEGYEFKYWEEYIDSTSSWVKLNPNSSGEVWITVGEVNDYRAIFGLKQLTVKFVDYDGFELSRQTVTWGAGATAPADPDNQEGHHFTGWDKDFSSVKQNMTVTALYAINTYTVTFKDYDGSEIGTDTVDWNTAATPPADPDNQDGYHFTGWDKDFSAVTEEMTVTALYAINTYTVTFKDYDGLELGTDTVDWNTAATPPADPDNLEGYHFTGWDKGFSNVKDNLTVTALYAINTYTVTFKDYDGSELGTDTVDWNTAATPPADPDNLEGYHFTGWDKGFSNVKDNLTVTALYAINSYTVIFKDHDGTVLSTQTVNWNTAATAPAGPDNLEGYHFTGWDKGFSNVKDNLTVTALYAINTYTVTFFDFDGTKLSTQTVNWNTAATAPTNSARTGYRFTGWNADFSAVKSNLNVTAQYVKRTYTVTFVDYDGTEIAAQTVSYNNGATAPAAPEREGYTFTGWDTSFDPVRSNLTVTAQYSINTFTVKFVDFDGTVIDTQTVDWNTGATAPADPARDGYAFTGWDTQFNAVKSDLTITAQYTAAEVINDENVPDGNGSTTVPDEGIPTTGSAGFAWWWIVVIVGAAAVLFLLIFFVVRRKKKEQEQE